MRGARFFVLVIYYFGKNINRKNYLLFDLLKANFSIYLMVHVFKASKHHRISIKLN